MTAPRARLGNGISAARRKIRRIYIQFQRRLVRWIFDRRTLARLTRRTHVLCLGDSNVTFLRGVRLPGAWLLRFGLGGATASGIINPNVDVQSSEAFTRRLDGARLWQQVLFMLGGVDCGFVIWHHCEQQGLDVQDVLQETLDVYSERIRRTIAMGFPRVLVVSAPLPTIGDSSDSQRPSGLRGTVTTTQLERTQLTLQFNAALQNRCQQLGARFIDVTTSQLDPNTGLIATRFVRATGRNHHLEARPYREILASELSALDW